MRRWFLALLTLICIEAQAGVQVKHPEFTFDLGGDWQQVPSDDPERWSAESKALGSSVVLSIVPEMRLPIAKVPEAARVFLDARLRGERAARPGQKVVFGESRIDPSPDGNLVEISYAGYDESGTVFRFYGIVTRLKVLSLWVATPGRSDQASRQAFEQAFRGLKYVVP